MVTVLSATFRKRLEKIRDHKPRIAWLLRSPTGPLFMWACFWFLPTGKAAGQGFSYFAKGMGCVYLLLMGMWISAYCLADLVAWWRNLFHGQQNLSDVNTPDNDHDVSENR
jgi:hypothetical protein